jgi:hypothetical protein
VAGDELNGRQYYELKGLLTDLSNQVKAVSGDTSSIKETLEGKGREPGVKQELRELKQQVEGRPPKYQDGVTYAVALLGENHSALRREFDEHVDNQERVEAGRTGRWKGAYTVYAVIAAALGFLGLAITVLLRIQESINRTLGGG